MFDSAATNHPTTAPGLDPGVALQLPVAAYHQLIRTLRLTLPPPLSDSPEDLRRRDHAAIARIAALAPASAAEADLAGTFVAASEQWKDCLRLAQEPGTTAEWAAKCRAQALTMMRQATGALRLMLRIQESRRKLEADPAACNSLAWTEHCAAGFMLEALAFQPAEHDRPESNLSDMPVPPGNDAQPEAARPSGTPAAIAAPLAPPENLKLPPEPAPVEEPAANPLAEPEQPEQYAAIDPEWPAQCGPAPAKAGDTGAAPTRRPGRLPPEAFLPERTPGPPDDDLVQTLVAAATPALAAPDRAFPEPRAA